MRDGFSLAMPFVIVGSLMVPLLFPPFAISSASRLGHVYLLLRPMLLPTFELTLGLVALIVAFGASASLAKQYQLPERLCGLTGCLSFLLFIGFRDNGATNIFLGGMGLFTALISSAYSIEIIRFFYKRGWCIRLPEEVPVMTRNGFQLLMPLLVIMLSISVMNAVMLQTTGQILPELIGEALRPLIVASDTLTAVLISLFLCNLLWFVGIHGALIITGIMNPFWLTYLFENQRALAAGEAVLPHIYLQGFWDFYLLIGGIGSTLPLVFMAMRSRSRQLKSVGKIGLLPSLFNINEPILFGFPVIMNPVFLLPFVFVPLINACIAWYLTQLGVLDRAVAMLPWSMPSPLGAAWSANGSWKNMCMCLFAFFNAWMLYRPFFKVHERQLMQLEK
ncbi:Putative permease IIC component ywbA [Enterobacter ludwigii]|uniref:Permease IIC component n=2 Tax=Enterobacter ludwigii TaxID=299767 RepID=G8LD97_9ENTR|nr:Putative permease IIC component ywbA [Enterobacter ludwigii]